MEELDFSKYYFVRKQSGEYLLICNDCGEIREVKEDLEEDLNVMLQDYNKLIEAACIARELAPTLLKLLPINRNSSREQSNKLKRLNDLIETIRHMP
jgi:DNA modification methylase